MFSCSFKNVFQIISHPTSVNTGHRHKDVLSFHRCFFRPFHVWFWCDM